MRAGWRQRSACGASAPRTWTQSHHQASPHSSTEPAGQEGRLAVCPCQACTARTHRPRTQKVGSLMVLYNRVVCARRARRCSPPVDLLCPCPRPKTSHVSPFLVGALSPMGLHHRDLRYLVCAPLFLVLRALAIALQKACRSRCGLLAPLHRHASSLLFCDSSWWLPTSPGQRVCPLRCVDHIAHDPHKLQADCAELRLLSRRFGTDDDVQLGTF